MFYYYVTNGFKYYDNYMTCIGITSNPAAKLRSFRTLIQNIKFAAIFGVQCTEKQILTFEAFVLHEFGNIRCNASENLRLANYCYEDETTLYKIIDTIHNMLKTQFIYVREINHENTMQIIKDEKISIYDYKNSIDGQNLIKQAIHDISTLLKKHKHDKLRINIDGKLIKI
jgi:hypothetical protein